MEADFRIARFMTTVDEKLRIVRFMVPVGSRLDPKNDAIKFRDFLCGLRGAREVKVFTRSEGSGRNQRFWAIVEYTGPLVLEELGDEKKYPTYYKEKGV